MERTLAVSTEVVARLDRQRPRVDVCRTPPPPITDRFRPLRQPRWQRRSSRPEQVLVVVVVVMQLLLASAADEGVSSSAFDSSGVSTEFGATHLQQCCAEQRVTSSCQEALCGGSISAASLPLTCYNDIGKMLRCLSGLRNATSCCLRQGIPVHCLAMCHGQAMELVMEGITCFNFMSSVAQCYDEEYVNLPGPPTSLTIVAVTTSSVELSWNPPSANADILSYYIVEYRQHSSFTSYQVSTTKLSWTIEDLSPSTLYEVSVTSVSPEGNSRPSAPASFLTYPAPSGGSTLAQISLSDTQTQTEPVHLAVVNRTSFTMTVTWTCQSNSELPAYSLQYRKNDQRNWTQTAADTSRCEEFIIQNLQPETAYSVQLTGCRSEQGITECPSNDAPVIEAETLHENLTKDIALRENIDDCCQRLNVSLTCSPICSGSDIIDLHKCADDLSKIVSCAAKVKDHTQCCRHVDVPSPCLAFCTGNIPRITDLPTLLCMSFIDQIFSCLQNENENLPEVPREFQVIELGSTYATFSWLMSEHTSDLVYQLYYSTVSPSGEHGRDIVVEDLSSPYTLTGLAPSSDYAVHLVSVGEFGTSHPTSSLMFRTHHGDSQFVQVHQSPLGYSSIGSQVTLTCSDQSSVKSLSLHHIYWLKDDTKVDGAVYVIESAQPEDSGRYTCVVEFNGGHFESAEAVVRVQFEPEVLPGDHHVTAAANEIGHLVCRFIGYPDLIDWYRSDGEMPISDGRFSVTRYLHEDLGAIDLSLSIENVSVSDYGVYRCEGRNIYGSAASYVWLNDVGTAETMLPGMDASYNRGIPSQPRNVHLSLTEVGYILVSWDVPHMASSSTIRFYRVYYAIERPTGVQSTNSVTVHEKTTVLSDILPFSSYNVSVVAGNEHGTSQPSTAAHIYAYELAPSSPQRVAAHVISDISVRVAWSQPDFHPDSVTGYRIYFAPASETGIHPYGTVHVAADCKEQLIDKLKAHTLYSIYVTAKSPHYESRPSDRVFALTDDYNSTPSLSFTYQHKVALAIGLAFILVAVATAAAMTSFHYIRKTKPKGRCRRSASFENPSYSGIEDTQVCDLLVSEGSADCSERLVCSTTSRTSSAYCSNPGRMSPDATESDSSTSLSNFPSRIVRPNLDIG